MSKWKHLRPGCRLRFEYLNYKYEVAQRDVIFMNLEYGQANHEWYPEPQWFLRCYDPSREADRSFALNRIDPEKLEVL